MIFYFHSVEKDGSPLSDEKQTIQTSLFSLLKDFLKSPTQEELHSVLGYILTVGEEGQVFFDHFCNALYLFFICVLSHDVLLSPSDGEGLGCAVRAAENQPPTGAGADSTVGVGRGAALRCTAQSKLRR